MCINAFVDRPCNLAALGFDRLIACALHCRLHGPVSADLTADQPFCTSNCVSARESDAQTTVSLVALLGPTESVPASFIIGKRNKTLEFFFSFQIKPKRKTKYTKILTATHIIFRHPISSLTLTSGDKETKEKNLLEKKNERRC